MTTKTAKEKKSQEELEELQTLDTKLTANLVNDVGYFDYENKPTGETFRFFVKQPSRMKNNKTSLWIGRTLTAIEYSPNSDIGDQMFNFASYWGQLNASIVSIKKINGGKFEVFEIEGEKSEEYPFDLYKDTYSFLFEKFVVDYPYKSNDINFVGEIWDKYMDYMLSTLDMTKDELKKS